ncbi:serine/arginine repetitive matrix protein 1-like [Pleurodeles waltl]|uniref:serine/arginine repetitive matrix protein 1-like n=1 Tax=Pleurodeles waltl TaxID=8319 RepID=UPI0037096165
MLGNKGTILAKKKRLAKEVEQKNVCTKTNERHSKKKKEGKSIKAPKEEKPSNTPKDGNPPSITRDQPTLLMPPRLYAGYTAIPILPVRKRRSDGDSRQPKVGDSSKTSTNGILTIGSRPRHRATRPLHTVYTLTPIKPVRKRREERISRVSNTGNRSRTASGVTLASRTRRQNTANMSNTGTNTAPARARGDECFCKIPKCENLSQMVQYSNPTVKAEDLNQGTFPIAQYTNRATGSRAERKRDESQANPSQDWKPENIKREQYRSSSMKNGRARSRRAKKQVMSADDWTQTNFPADQYTSNRRTSARASRRDVKQAAADGNRSKANLSAHRCTTNRTTSARAPNRRFENPPETAEEWKQPNFPTDPNTANKRTSVRVTRRRVGNHTNPQEDCYIVEPPADMYMDNTQINRRPAKRRRSQSHSKTERELENANMPFSVHASNMSTASTPSSRWRIHNPFWTANRGLIGSHQRQQPPDLYAASSALNVSPAKRRRSRSPNKSSSELQMANMRSTSHTSRLPPVTTPSQRWRFQNSFWTANPTPGSSKQRKQSPELYMATTPSNLRTARRRGQSPVNTTKEFQMAHTRFGSPMSNRPTVSTPTQRWKFQDEFWTPTSIPSQEGSQERQKSPVQRNRRGNASSAGDKGTTKRRKMASPSQNTTPESNIRPQLSHLDDVIFHENRQQRYRETRGSKSKRSRSGIKYWLSRIF